MVSLVGAPLAFESALEGSSMPARLLETLERLLALPSADLRTTLASASDFVAEATQCDKVDAFLYDATRDCLVAVGSSHQPLSALQRRLGLDVLPVSNGGRVVHVYTSGETFLSGHLDEDEEELRGIKEGLGIRSNLGVPLAVGGTVRGVLMLASLKPDFFSAEDVRFTEAVGRWTSMLAHRAELVEEIGRNAAAQGRRAAAEELVTVLAHDLRNLLSPLTLRLHVVRRRAESQARHDDVDDLDAIQRGLGRLATLAGDILDVARIDRGLFETVPRPVELVPLVEETARSLATPAHPVHVTVAATGDVVIAADATRLRQCLENLITNAIQKSPKDAPVEVNVATQRRDSGEWAVVEVIDHGPGVPAEVLPHIFEAFVTRKGGEGGLGLGLYLARQIALMHGGALGVESPPGRGARFTLELPCCAPDD
jgi:signal transduction histidine kinase